MKLLLIATPILFLLSALVCSSDENVSVAEAPRDFSTHQKELAALVQEIEEKVPELKESRLELVQATRSALSSMMKHPSLEVYRARRTKALTELGFATRRGDHEKAMLAERELKKATEEMKDSAMEIPELSLLFERSNELRKQYFNLRNAEIAKTEHGRKLLEEEASFNRLRMESNKK